MADKLYTVVDGVPSPLDLGTGGSGENLPGIDERVTALEEYQTVQDEAIAQTRNELEATIEENKGILPVGMEYIRLTGQTPYPGGVDYLGQEATRAMYADLWTWKNEHKPESIISEEAWQALYASQNGNVPFFSTGDGSTTFRFPRAVTHLKGAASVGEIGSYTKEGLPDASHTHTRGTMNITGTSEWNIFIPQDYTTGAFSRADGHSGRLTGSLTTPNYALSFDASRAWTGETSVASLSESSPIYGASDHVTPESMTVVMGVIAFGVTGAFGEATEEGIVQELELHGAKLSGLESELADLDERKADAEVDGKGIVRSVNGEVADADGAVTIGVTKVSWPDWTAKIDASGGSVKNTAPSDGWVCWGHVASVATTQFYLNDIQLGAIWGHSGGWGDSCAICVPVTKGDIYYCTGTPTWFYFVPCKGA